MRSRRALVAALAVGVLVLAQVPASSAWAIKLIAHRGGAGQWPENTLTAFRNAHEQFKTAGVPGWLEMDVQFTSDHKLVVIHDATLDRTTDCTGPVIEKMVDEVMQCDADPGPGVEGVPTLAQVLEEGLFPNNWRLVVEIKNIPGEPGFDLDCRELADALRREVNTAGFPKTRLIVQSFWPFCLDRLELTDPAIATLLLTSSSTINALAGLASPVPLGFTLTANALYATLHGYEYSAPDQDTIDLIHPVVFATHLLGRKVVVWTVDDPATMNHLAAIGVDGIISDRPDILISELG